VLLYVKQLSLCLDFRSIANCSLSPRVTFQIRFDERSGNLAVTDIGRIASFYYVHNNSVFTFNEILARKVAGSVTTDFDVLNLICSSHEFSQIKVWTKLSSLCNWLR
jgi:replicative superfamily II helicase